MTEIKTEWVPVMWKYRAENAEHELLSLGQRSKARIATLESAVTEARDRQEHYRAESERLGEMYSCIKEIEVEGPKGKAIIRHWPFPDMPPYIVFLMEGMPQTREGKRFEMLLDAFNAAKELVGLRGEGER